MISAFVTGAGPLHRLPATLKLLAFAAISLALVLLPAGAWSFAVGLTVAASAIVAAWLPPRILLVDTLRVLPFVLFIAAAVWWFQGIEQGMTTGSRVLAIFVLASVLTRTTRVEDVLQAWPLRLSERLGLAVALTLTMIPVLSDLGRQVWLAQRSRGLRPSLRRWLMPFIVLSLKHADDVDDALRARVRPRE
ncbi:energy-coupling factor transporter transmembrane component T family protein [Agrococcus casei]|uniref:energy-coupling factor transporter transmembrane component T family protein n=1 Tax=Agrococcus casei TaxID=343512 RepID=UPI0013564255|nr:energy-coupling factor transporter transmembrane component T [Agrococcus casei]